MSTDHYLPDFDESDEKFMTSIGNAVAIHIPSVFAKSIQISGHSHSLHYAAVSSMSTANTEKILDVVRTCLGDFYARHKGPKWQEDKLFEMAEPGLVYIWYENEGRISCFLSVMMVLEPAGKTLYLYEIHVSPQFQGHQLGSRLMSDFHKLAVFLNVEAGRKPLALNRHLASSSTGLTVFSDNDRAFQWYLRLGYTFASDSPLDKLLRNGKVLKPSIYVLSRPLDTADAM